MAYVTHTIQDYSGERSYTRHYLPAITDANFDAIAGNGVGDNVGDLRLALAAVCEGTFVKHEVTCVTSRDGIFVATDPDAQRERKIVIRCVDSLNYRFTIEIPCPNLALLAQPDTDEIDRTVTEWQTLETALITTCRSKNDVAFTVLGARHVGRRL